MNVTEIRTNENQAIIDVVTDLAKVHRLEGLPEGHVAFAVPKGFNALDLTAAIDKRTEERAAGPRRIKGMEVAETLDGFIELVKRHSTPASAIFALGGEKPKFTAVIDYHGASLPACAESKPAADSEAKVHFGDGPVPAWREQKVFYGFPLSDSFKEWSDLAQKFVIKKDFLQWVRDHVLDVVDPSEVAADSGSVTRTVFEAVLRAQGKPKADREKAPLEALFGSPSALLDGASRLAAISSKQFEETEHGLGGISVSYQKEDKVTGTEKVKEYYLVEIEVFPGSAKTILPARLKTKVADGALYLTLELLGVKEMIEAAFKDAIRQVEGHTGVPIYRASLAG